MPVETVLGPAGTGRFPIPAAVARELALAGGAPRWLRRLFVAASTGRLVQLETHAREFTDAQRQFLIIRDQTCRTPWCNAPIRHADHVEQHALGGETAVANGAGRCANCNYALASPGWRSSAAVDGTITTRTPTGHTYQSPEPRPPASPPIIGPPPIVEHYRDLGPIEIIYLGHRAA